MPRRPCQRPRAANGRFVPRAAPAPAPRRAPRPMRRRAVRPRRQRGAQSRMVCPGSSEESSATKIVKRKPLLSWQRSLKKMTSVQCYDMLSTGVYTSNVGRQSYPHYDLANIADLERVTIAAESLIPTAAAATAQNAKCFLRKISMNLRMVNTSTVPVTLTMYHYRMRYATDLSASTMYETYAIDQSLNPERVGATPFQMARWGHFYRIYKQRKVVLQGGSTHIINYDIDVNYSLSPDTFNDTAGQAGIVGISRGVLVMAYGGLIQDATTNAISTAATQIAFEKRLKFWFYLTAGRSTKSFYDGNYGDMTPGNARFINEDQDEVEPPAEI